ncbi:MAG: urease accessory protein UreD, partial [Mesorhizobium sp.]
MIEDILISLPAAQRVAGRGRLFCGKSRGRTRLQRLY